MVKQPALLGYAILTGAVVLAFAATWHNDKEIEKARDERVGQINRVNRAQCASLRNLYSIIAKSLRDGDDAIDKIAYYRTHQAERAEAHRRNMVTIDRFRLPPCPDDIELEE